ncbi:hypothetical protein GCM10010103_60240 [Streptomyces paradoxus]
MSLGASPPAGVKADRPAEGVAAREDGEVPPPGWRTTVKMRRVRRPRGSGRSVTVGPVRSGPGHQEGRGVLR